MRRLGIGVAAVLGLLLLGACASVGPGSGSEGAPLNTLLGQVTDVDDDLRPLRVCLMAAGVAELMTDRIQAFDASQADVAMGRLMVLRNAVSKSRTSSPMWLNTDMADVSLLFAKVLKDAGRRRLVQILAGGPTISNFLNVARRGTVLTVKGTALLKDINSMLSSVDDGSLEEAVALRACEDRMRENQNVLSVLIGGTTSQ